MKYWLLLCVAVIALPGVCAAKGPSLTKRQVSRLADVTARHHAFNPHRYDRSTPVFSRNDHSWRVMYTGKPDEHGRVGMDDVFYVQVDDPSGQTHFTVGP